MDYVPLYIKTEYSLLSSLIKIDDLIEFAKANNYSSLTITDSNMFGVMEFYQKCIKNNIKPIIGLEVTLNHKIILYARNEEGYKNLIKLSTIISNHPIEIEELEKYSTSLICILPFNSRSFYNEISKIYEHVFIGYETKEEYDLLEDSKAVYMRETLSLNKQDQKYLSYLWAIRDSKKIDEVNIDNKRHYLITKNEVETLEYNQNNQKIIDLCQIELKMHQDLLPVYECKDGLDAFSYLKQLCQEKMRHIFGSKVNKIYVDRLKYELEIINQMGFCNYFLVVYDYIKYAKDNHILVGPGRGSAAGSLVAYLLNITTIDPILYNLVFERFLNPERITMPDIDIDVQDSRREEVINYCIKKYGVKKVAGIIAFGTLASKQAIRDVGRVMDIDLTKINALCKMITSNLNLRENYNQNKKIQDVLKGDSKIFELYKISLKLEGLKRHTTVHAAGIVMCNKNLDEVIPLYERDGVYLTAYSKDFIEDIGLLKMDILAIQNLTLIGNIIKEINENKEMITFDNIPLEDKSAIDIFSKVDTLGIFQFESNGMMQFLRKLKPTTFEDIVAALALFRPGPMGNIDHYIKRKNQMEKIEYFDPSLKSILDSTYGIIIYQEQIIEIASKMAGFTLGEADILRRAMSKKKESVLLKEKDRFINGSIKKGYHKKTAEEIFNLILKFASYGFNRAHSVSYAMISYKMAYLKAHYRPYFMKCILTSELNSLEKTKSYIYECKAHNLSILKPDINQSGKEYKMKNNSILYPLTGIRNLGITIVSEILKEREKGDFKNIYDFVKRTDRKIINKRVLISLIDAGCFDKFTLNHRTMIEGIDLIINYGELIKDLDEEFVLKPELVILDEYPKQELLKRELEVLGLYISDNPITQYKQKNNIKIDLADISNYFDKIVDIIVMIDSIKEIQTKNNKKMCFLKLSDELTTIDGVLFPRDYEKINPILLNKIVKIRVKVEKRLDKYQLIIHKIDYLEES